MVMDPKVLILLSTLLSSFRITASNLLFYEPFKHTFEGRWTVSQKHDYKGSWQHSKSEGHDDYGLLVSEKARKYAIVKELDQPFCLRDKLVVLQFEVRPQKGLECGGAYLKYLRSQEAGWTPEEFDEKSPYSIMFGPDKCGSTKKVHFILNLQNPMNGEYFEHHLKFPPSMPTDKLTHVYTAILRPNNELRILIDGVEKKKAKFLSDEDFEPSLIPPKTIPDPYDKKPDDWDEQVKIPDPHAVKPDDWDKDAPMEIVDEEAVKPDGWLDDESEDIDEPGAVKPEDWDDEEDGTWEPPKVQNPKCALAPGCGEWKKPIKRNPAYKGKWHAPLVNNPNYKGLWKPREVPNPNYYEIHKPDFDPIAAIGIEIWTMQDGILFDNILITSDAKLAESYRETTWKPKFQVEMQKQKAEEAWTGLSDAVSKLQKKVFDILYKIADFTFLEAYKSKIIDIIRRAETEPQFTVGLPVALVVLLLSVFFATISAWKKPKVKVAETKRHVAEGTSREHSRDGR
ncbi:hypothetical protein SLE2022_212870 [Rubroshorea leprosula]